MLGKTKFIQKFVEGCVCVWGGVGGIPVRLSNPGSRMASKDSGLYLPTFSSGRTILNKAKT